MSDVSETPETAHKPKPKVIFEVPPTIGIFKRLFAIHKYENNTSDFRYLVSMCYLFLFADKNPEIENENTAQVLQVLCQLLGDYGLELEHLVWMGTEFDCMHSELNPLQICDEYDRYEIIAEAFAKHGKEIDENKGILLPVLAVLAAVDGVYSENKKRLIRRLRRTRNEHFRSSESGYAIDKPKLEALEQIIYQLCENEKRRWDIRSSNKSYQQVHIELSQLEKADEQLITSLSEFTAADNERTLSPYERTLLASYKRTLTSYVKCAGCGRTYSENTTVFLFPPPQCPYCGTLNVIRQEEIQKDNKGKRKRSKSK
ncbi:hypothetical protein Holit_03140 [Hollandina sp. SP2]